MLDVSSDEDLPVQAQLRLSLENSSLIGPYIHVKAGWKSVLKKHAMEALGDQLYVPRS